MTQQARPDANLQAERPLSPVQKKHQELVVDRGRKQEAAMMAYAAVGVSPDQSSLSFSGKPHLQKLGTTVIYSLRRFWPENGRRPVILLAGYYAGLENGKIAIGGAERCAFAHDLRFRPYADAPGSGKICPAWKETTLAAFFKMDAAIGELSQAGGPVQQSLRLPGFWAGFSASDVGEVEDCQGTRRLSVETLKLGSPLGCMAATGGTVRLVAREADFDSAPSQTVSGQPRRPDTEKGIVIGWNGDRDNPDTVQTLPHCAVLRPFVREGVVIEPGTILGDFGPRRAYPNWTAVQKALGERTADWLMGEAVAAMDYEFGGLICRSVEMCPSMLGRAFMIFEDRLGLVDDNQDGLIQVTSGRGTASLEISQFGGLVSGNLWDVRPGWVKRFS